jgi:aldehyde dehydrogenase (NAD+)
VNAQQKSTPCSRDTPKVELRIGDKVLSASSGGMHAHINPATGRVQSEFLLAGAREMNAAVESSAEAFEVWKTWRAGQRRDVLMRLANLIEANANEFTRRAVLDNGTPISQATAGAYFAKAWTAYYAGWADKLDGAVTSTFAQGGDIVIPGFPISSDFSYTLQQPFGVIGAIVTWNGPLINMGMKLGAILAAGNTVVMKPSELTPYAADLLGTLVREAGIPEGVVNMIPGGAEAGKALVEHPLVRKVSFTGGITAARSVLAACGAAIKPAVLELGGKAAYIIFEDATLDDAVLHSAIVGAGLLAGQSCACAGRLLVHRAIYKDVLERTVELVGKFPMGDPWDPATQIGPVITEGAVERVLGMIGRAKAQDGVRMLIGGKRAGGALSGGYYIEPTLFAEVDPASEIAQDEVFGPVVGLVPFDTEEEAIRITNGTKFGLASYLHTHDLRRALRVSEQINTGAVYINGAAAVAPNTPYGGLAMSGFGREGGRQGIDEFLRPKTVAIA